MRSSAGRVHCGREVLRKETQWTRNLANKKLCGGGAGSPGSLSQGFLFIFSFLYFIIYGRFPRSPRSGGGENTSSRHPSAPSSFWPSGNLLPLSPHLCSLSLSSFFPSLSSLSIPSFLILLVPLPSHSLSSTFVSFLSFPFHPFAFSRLDSVSVALSLLPSSFLIPLRFVSFLYPLSSFLSSRFHSILSLSLG